MIFLRAASASRITEARPTSEPVPAVVGMATTDAITSAIRRLAQYIGLELSTFEGFLDWVLKLRREIGIPEDLTSLEIGDDKAQQIGKMAFEDPSASTNPISLSPADYETIFRKAVCGHMNCATE